MNDEQLRDAYERGLPKADGSTSLDDVAAERLRRLVEREGTESERLRTLDLALSSGEGRRELEIAWAGGKSRAAAAPIVAALRDGGIAARRRWKLGTLVARARHGIGERHAWLRVAGDTDRAGR